jgi:hypothetical protein
LTFTEPFFPASGSAEEFLLDPDIWVMNMVDGSLTNLTEDGVDGLYNDPRSVIGVLPRWSGDSQRLAFIRYTPGHNTPNRCVTCFMFSLNPML